MIIVSRYVIGGSCVFECACKFLFIVSVRIVCDNASKQMDYYVYLYDCEVAGLCEMN